MASSLVEQRRVLLELLLLIGIPLTLAHNLNLENSSYIIFPFAILILARMIQLVQSGKLTKEEDIYAQQDRAFGWMAYIILTLLSLVLFIGFNIWNILPNWLSYIDPLWLIASHTLLQELVFRTYILNRLKVIFSDELVIIVVSAMIFAYAHSFLPDAQLMVVGTGFIGAVWAHLYLRFPNIWAVWLSHFLINLTLFDIPFRLIEHSKTLF